MKKATSVEEQLSILRDRGIIISDDEKAKEILLDIGYYRMGFYLFPFEITYPSLDNRSHKYKPNTNFNSAVTLYYFDFDLRNLLLRYIARIEVAFRTYLTYFLSNKYKDSPTWFVDTKYVDNSFKNSFRKAIYEELTTQVQAIKRHHKNYINDKYAPAWKTIEFMSFGAVIKLYKAIKDPKDKIEIAKHFGIRSISTFENYISTVKTIRNKCAHGNVLFDFNLPQAIAGGPIKFQKGKESSLSTAIDVIIFILSQISKNRACELKDYLKKIIYNANIKDPNIKEITENIINF